MSEENKLPKKTSPSHPVRKETEALARKVLDMLAKKEKPAGRGDWWMFGREPTHNRRSPYLGAQRASLKWRYETGGPVFSSPAIGSDGTIYVGSDDDCLYAFGD